MNVSKLQCFMVREPGATKQFTITNSADVLDLITNELHLDQSPVEKLYSIHLNSHNKVIGYELISQGDQTGAEAKPSNVFRGAILGNACAIILVHNHPSGDESPSNADKAVTETMIQVGKLVGIPVLDHLIIGDASHYTSLRDEGYF